MPGSFLLVLLRQAFRAHPLYQSRSGFLAGCASINMPLHIQASELRLQPASPGEQASCIDSVFSCVAARFSLTGRGFDGRAGQRNSFLPAYRATPGMGMMIAAPVYRSPRLSGQRYAVSFQHARHFACMATTNDLPAATSRSC